MLQYDCFNDLRDWPNLGRSEQKADGVVHVDVLDERGLAVLHQVLDIVLVGLKRRRYLLTARSWISN